MFQQSINNRSTTV